MTLKEKKKNVLKMYLRENPIIRIMHYMFIFRVYVVYLDHISKLDERERYRIMYKPVAVNPLLWIYIIFALFHKFVTEFLPESFSLAVEAMTQHEELQTETFTKNRPKIKK